MAARQRNDWPGRLARLLVVADLLAVTVAVLVAYLIRVVAGELDTSRWWFYPGLALLTGAVWMGALALVGGYQVRILSVGTEEFRRILVASATVFVGVSVIAYTFQYLVPRAFILVALPLGFVLLAGERFAIRQYIHQLRQDGRLQHRVLLVGDPGAVTRLAKQFLAEPLAGFLVVGTCTSGARSADMSMPVVGTLKDVAATARRMGVDTVAVAPSAEVPADLLRTIAWSLEGSNIDLIVAPAVTDVAGPRITVRPVAGLPLLYVDEPTFSGPSRVMKRASDLVLGSLLIVLLAVPMLLMWVLIRLTSHGKGIFRQVRVGRDGQEFNIYKFRSMYADAEQRWAELAELNENDGLLFKLTDDPRVTPVGRFLRRWSLDELPQLVNVLRGDMSLVGPRPLAVDGSDMEGHVRRRLLVRPGTTGLWQVSGRKDVSWDEAVRMDLYYVENWSLSMDFTVLLRTLLAVWRGEGAY